MLTAYMDESSHETGTVFVAGFIGNEAQWNSFLPAWKEALGKRHRLHMKRLRWSNSRTKDLLARLAPVPYRAGLKPILGAITDTDYKDLFDNKEVFHKTFMLALVTLLILLLKELPPEETVKFVFDRQLQYELPMRALFNALEKNRTPGKSASLASVEFVHHSILTGPADYLAYATTQMGRNPSSKKAMWCRPIFSEMPPWELFFVWPSKERIRKLIEMTRSGNG